LIRGGADVDEQDAQRLAEADISLVQPGNPGSRPLDYSSSRQSRCAVSQMRETPTVRRSFVPLDLTNAKDSASNFPLHPLENSRSAGEKVRINGF
jgi:hypothetical protein